MKHFLTIAIFTLLLTTPSVSKIKVVASLTDLADFATIVGGEKVQVDCIVRGTQNPHFIDVKPSYMMKLKSADLFLMIGMELELWAPQIIDGSRNSNLVVVDCSRNVKKLEVPTSKTDASAGDVHPLGNPHYWLDPENAQFVLQEIFESLSRISPSDREYFKKNMDEYVRKLNAKISEWTALMKPLQGTKLVTYHTSFSYFANRFGLTVVGYVEPKPGIPPSPSHSADLIKLMRSSGVKLIGLEQYFEDSTPTQIAATTGANLVRLSTSVGGVEGTDDYLKLIEYNVKAIVAAVKGR